MHAIATRKNTENIWNPSDIRLIIIEVRLFCCLALKSRVRSFLHLIASDDYEIVLIFSANVTFLPKKVVFANHHKSQIQITQLRIIYDVGYLNWELISSNKSSMFCQCALATRKRKSHNKFSSNSIPIKAQLQTQGNRVECWLYFLQRCW